MILRTSMPSHPSGPHTVFKGQQPPRDGQQMGASVGQHPSTQQDPELAGQQPITVFPVSSKQHLSPLAPQQ